MSWFGSQLRGLSLHYLTLESRFELFHDGSEQYLCDVNGQLVTAAGSMAYLGYFPNVVVNK